MPEEQPTKEEIEFRQTELELFMRRYSLEGFEDVLDWVLRTIKKIISRGEIPATEAGVTKAMSLIVSAYPEIDQYLRKFCKAVSVETLREMKQTARPN